MNLGGIVFHSSASLFKLDGNSGRAQWTFADVRSELAAVAAGVLSKAGLPGKAKVYYNREDPTKWTCDQPAHLAELLNTPPAELDAKAWKKKARASPYNQAGVITHFVIEVRKFGHDSDEGLAAHIIEAAAEAEAEQLELQRAMLGAFELGRAAAVLLAYRFPVYTGKTRRDPQPHPGKVKATSILREILKNDRSLTEDSAWKAMRDEGEESGVYCADEGAVEAIKVESSGKPLPWRCTRSSFRKQLLKPVRDAIRTAGPEIRSP
ncbi:MAG: hypothetical protein ACT4PZ_24500 [Panacagrimonas sp.]